MILKYNQFIFESKSTLLELQDNVDHELIGIIQSLIPSGEILEISCGNGSDSIELQNLGYDITATDSNKDYSEKAGEFVKSIQHDTKNKFPFSDNSFDLIYSRLGLHYFTKDELLGIFDELLRMTKKYLVFTVKLVNDIQTGKVIFDQKFWEELTSINFEIISSKSKTGILYENESKWLEVVAKKRN